MKQERRRAKEAYKEVAPMYLMSYNSIFYNFLLFPSAYHFDFCFSISF
jgi:hypothetical protein